MFDQQGGLQSAIQQRPNDVSAGQEQGRCLCQAHGDISVEAAGQFMEWNLC